MCLGPVQVWISSKNSDLNHTWTGKQTCTGPQAEPQGNTYVNLALQWPCQAVFWFWLQWITKKMDYDNINELLISEWSLNILYAYEYLVTPKPILLVYKSAGHTEDLHCQLFPENNQSGTINAFQKVFLSKKIFHGEIILYLWVPSIISSSEDVYIGITQPRCKQRWLNYWRINCK